MANILFIKTSSLGDVIYHMPALTDARKARGDAAFSWLVEEAFAPLVRLHPAVDEIIPVAWRRWRKSLYAPATMAEIVASFRAIRAHQYDDIIDNQGLLRSAVIARMAHGRRHGYDASSVREPLGFSMLDVTVIASTVICTRSSATGSLSGRRSVIRRRVPQLSGSIADDL